MNKIKQSILAIVIGLVLSAGVSYAAGIWENPKDNPPNKNTDTPINTGLGDQIKAGALRIGNPTLGFVVDGASSFKGQSQFLNPVIFKGQITIDKSPTYGAVLTSDAVGNTSWKMPKTQIVISEDMKSTCSKGNPCDNTWTGSAATCPTGYVRTGCTTSCAGTFSEASPDLFPVEGQEACNIGNNDRCVSTGGPDYPGRIRVRAICLRVGN